jgi:hypothetical protein
MIRNMKVLGIAVMAVLAMSAVVASAASAANFTASGYPATGTGEQKGTHVFTVQGQKVTCTTAHFEGSLSAASTTLDVKPKYEGCTAFGFANAKVDMNSCFFRFTLTGGTEPNYNGAVHIVCTVVGDTITVTAPASTQSCVVHIPQQTPTTETVHYVDTNANNVHVTSTVAGIHTVVTHNDFLCPLSAASTDTTGKYEGAVEFKGIGGKTIDIG